MEIKLPEGARYILKKLYSSGYKGYIVGGCVRDSLLGKVPADFDIASNAQPCDVMDMFKDFKLLSTGLKHGTVTVIIDNMPFEVTTFRKEGAYSDYRRPDHVEFIGTIDEDLSRRDFTINSMAYNPREGLVDLYGGYEDLCNG
ncbi:MAG TPA: polynucleotide adenylyltransferase, partial [Clostridiaceae bacterium]|nr:polynucleotide adenylyltransferase [Clostridiaceae bacterium]